MKPKTATKHKRSFTPTEKAKALTDMKSDTDVNGSYTGAPKNPREIPVQDADDLSSLEFQGGFLFAISGGKGFGNFPNGMMKRQDA